MWADNETTQDFLNYEVHANLIKEYVTNPTLLPLTIGIFGDWGSGKSSIMRMLEEKLKNNERILTIYFNSWLFEDYENAKVSLIENILLELSKKEKLSDIGKKKLLELLSRVDYMKLTSDGIKKYGKNIIDIFSTGGVFTAIEAGYSMIKNDTFEKIQENGFEDFDKYIKQEQDNPTKNIIKTFRRDFDELIKATDYDSVVIFIDDLDRCLPERVIDTLEAIKLFLSVPNTAFVIGADERIIKHSISMHLKLHTFNNDSEYLQNTQQIVTDYIEKLIQIPYRIPKLSSSEIESYNNLLFSSSLLEKDDFGKVYQDYLTFRKGDFYSAYSYGHIKEKIDFDNEIDLSNLINLSHNMSKMITSVLKGNPRQTKRFLNTFILRSKLAEVAQIEINIFVLIKLMLLEYFDTKLFKKLNEFQSQNNGFFKELSILEAIFIDNQEDTLASDFKEWKTLQIQNWIKIEPRLSDVDLRNYFWLARDRIDSALSYVHMVSPIVQKIYKGLISTKETEIRFNLENLKQLKNDELIEIIKLFSDEINVSSDISNLLNNLHKVIIMINTRELYIMYINIINNIPYAKINKFIYIIDKLEEVKHKEPSLREDVITIITMYSCKQKGLLRNAAIKYLEKGN